MLMKDNQKQSLSKTNANGYDYHIHIQYANVLFKALSLYAWPR